MGTKTLSLNKKECEEVAAEGGFQPENVEKVSYLLTALKALNEDDFLKDRLVLKGGTALNLFHFQMPRLSVDIDLNYVGSSDKDVMEADRLEIEKKIKVSCKGVHLNLQTGQKDHANRGYKALYRSNFVPNAQIKIDINYLHRICLWEPEAMDSFKLGRLQAIQIPVISIYELAAGKLCALLGRAASRDLFDVDELSTKIKNTDKNLRLAYIVYAAKQTKDWTTVTENDVRLEEKDVEEQLFPVLSAEMSKKLGTAKECAEMLTKSCKHYVKPLTELSPEEFQFIKQIRNDGKIEPSLITSDLVFQSKIAADPAILYRCLKADKSEPIRTEAPKAMTKKNWDPKNLTERMRLALVALSGSSNSMQKRIELCVFQLLPLRAEDFPEEMQSEFEYIVNFLSASGSPSSGGSLREVTKALTDEDAKEVIERIVDLCVSTWELLGNSDS